MPPADHEQVDFDFIVVGGGTAGLVVAARLTENPNIQVGVIEAGPAHLGDPMIMTPALYPRIIGTPKYDWLFRSTPQGSNFGDDLEVSLTLLTAQHEDLRSSTRQRAGRFKFYQLPDVQSWPGGRLRCLGNAW